MHAFISTILGPKMPSGVGASYLGRPHKGEWWTRLPHILSFSRIPLCIPEYASYLGRRYGCGGEMATGTGCCQADKESFTQLCVCRTRRSAGLAKACELAHPHAQRAISLCHRNCPHLSAPDVSVARRRAATSKLLKQFPGDCCLHLIVHGLSKERGGLTHGTQHPGFLFWSVPVLSRG